MTDFDERFAERTVREVKEDFLRRQSERRFLEKSWELNMNFLAGNQYCTLNAAGEIEEEEPALLLAVPQGVQPHRARHRHALRKTFARATGRSLCAPRATRRGICAPPNFRRRSSAR